MNERLSNSLLILVCTILLCVMNACAPVHSNDIVAEGETPVKISDSYSFTEGPAADARGDVYFTDQPNNKIYHWDCESGEITLFTDQSGRSNGMYFDAQGNLIACADMDPENACPWVVNRGKKRCLRRKGTFLTGVKERLYRGKVPLEQGESPFLSNQQRPCL